MFRIKQLSDAELRKAWEDAETIRIAETKEIEARKDDSAKRRAERRAKCSDVVYKTRNEAECQQAYSTMWMLNDEQPRSRQKIYESIIVGACNFLGDDRGVLVKNKCLPQ